MTLLPEGQEWTQLRELQRARMWQLALVRRWKRKLRHSRLRQYRLGMKLHAAARAGGSANVAAPIGATVETQAAPVQAAPVQAGHEVAQVHAVHAGTVQAAPVQAAQVAAPVHAVLAATRGCAGSLTAPTSMEGSRRANFPILTQGCSDKK